MGSRKFLKLKRRMEDFDVSMDQVADRAKVSKDTIRTRLSGQSDWRGSEILTICRLVDIKPEEIGEYFFPELGA